MYVGVGVGARERVRACARVALLLNMQRTSLAPPHFSILSHTRHDFRKKKCTEYKVCVA